MILGQVVVLFYDNDELFSKPSILQENSRINRDYRNKIHLLNLQYKGGLKILKL